MTTPKDLARQLEQVDRVVTEAITCTLTEAGARMVADAKALIGTEPDMWPALATATIAEKQRLGYTGQVSPTDPLLRTGDLRDSITAEVEPDGIVLGSSSPIASYMELGTITVPPRPFLRPTMEAHVEEIAHSVAGAAAEAIRTLLRGR